MVRYDLMTAEDRAKALAVGECIQEIVQKMLGHDGDVRDVTPEPAREP